VTFFRVICTILEQWCIGALTVQINAIRIIYIYASDRSCGLDWIWVSITSSLWIGSQSWWIGLDLEKWTHVQLWYKVRDMEGCGQMYGLCTFAKYKGNMLKKRTNYCLLQLPGRLLLQGISYIRLRGWNKRSRKLSMKTKFPTGFFQVRPEIVDTRPRLNVVEFTRSTEWISLTEW